MNVILENFDIRLKSSLMIVNFDSRQLMLKKISRSCFVIKRKKIQVYCISDVVFALY